MEVWLNGRFVPLDEARISAFDAGFQHAVGLFETLSAREGRVFRAEAHVARLIDSATTLGLTERLDAATLEEAIEATCRRNGLDDARIRLTVSGGDLNLLHRDRAGGNGRKATELTILIHAQPPTVYPDRFFEEGVTTTIADARLNPLDPFAGHKTLNYWSRLRALQHAAALGAGEALWFTVSNHLAGGSLSKVVLVKDGEVLTPIARGEEASVAREGASTAGQGDPAPILPSPVLPGITRAAVIELAEAADHPVARRMLDIDALLGADEVFLTNSSWGILPVTQVERSTIAGGDVGPLTRRMRAAWLDLVRHDL